MTISDSYLVGWFAGEGYGWSAEWWCIIEKILSINSISLLTLVGGTK